MDMNYKEFLSAIRLIKEKRKEKDYYDYHEFRSHAYAHDKLKATVIINHVGRYIFTEPIFDICEKVMFENSSIGVDGNLDKTSQYTIIAKHDGAKFLVDFYYVSDNEYYDSFTFHCRREDVDKVHDFVKTYMKSIGKVKNSINLLSLSDGKFNLIEHKIKNIELNLDYYNDGFAEINDKVIASLNQDHEKGFFIFHGIQGSGKTTYIRYLLSQIENKQVIFIPPALTSELANPSFIKFLQEFNNSVLVIEDAENIMMQRIGGTDSAVSNILNLSDGILSDILSIQLIVTFNTDIRNIDKALLRPGRLSVRYEFAELAPHKIEKITDGELNKKMTLAEVLNRDDKPIDSVKEAASIGF